LLINILLNHYCNLYCCSWSNAAKLTGAKDGTVTTYGSTGMERKYQEQYQQLMPDVCSCNAANIWFTISSPYFSWT